MYFLFLTFVLDKYFVKQLTQHLFCMLNFVVFFSLKAEIKKKEKQKLFTVYF